MMQNIQKVFICGLGAVGSAYASQIFEFNPNGVKVIADPKRIEKYRQNQVTVNGKSYPFDYIRPDSNEKPADLMIIAVKQHHLTESINNIRNFIGEQTIILSLLNGITSEEIIGSEFGMEKMLYSFVVGTDAVREGTDTRFSKLGTIVFGEKHNQELSPRVKTVKELYEKVKIPYQIPENMLRELWWKFMMNVGVNQVSAVLKAPYGIFQRIGEARELMEMASREVIAISQKIGIELHPNDIDKYLKIIDTLAPEGKTSMLQDVEASRKTEVEIFAGTVVELGKKYEINTPVNEVLLRMIRTLEQTYR